jgi:DNA mismatch endonuclease (patch repair protein)
MTWPKSNHEFWRNKIERNMERDRETIELLRSESWEAVVIWEHENPIDAADRVFELVEKRRSDYLPRKTADLGDNPTGRGRSDRCQR